MLFTVLKNISLNKQVRLEGKFILPIIKYTFMYKTLFKQRNWLPGEGVEPTLLDVFKTSLEKALGNLVCLIVDTVLSRRME